MPEQRRRDAVVPVWWAIVKFVVALVLAPFVAPFVGWWASVNYERAKGLMRVFPHQLAALASGRVPLPPANRVARLDASIDAVIVSDLHRSYRGRRDWASSQGDTAVYEVMLDHYGGHGWHVVENGDTDDFWLVGGSAYGSAYDASRLVAALIPGRVGRRARSLVYQGHFARIRANNRGIYRRLTELGRAGRYHRNVGNHDDAFLDTRLAGVLWRRCAVRATDWLVLESDGRAEAVITHGNQTDAWNTPGRAFLGRMAMWISNTLSDVPLLDSPEPLPDEAKTRLLLSDGARNGLMRLHPRFGVNANYDSLDEELLFDAVGGAVEAGPWLMMGHTHSPLLQPLSRTGVRWMRYANSGHGLWQGMITAIEWEGSLGPPFGPRLVGWVRLDRETDLGREVLLPDDAVIVKGADGTTIAPWSWSRPATGRDSRWPVSDRCGRTRPRPAASRRARRPPRTRRARPAG